MCDILVYNLDTIITRKLLQIKQFKPWRFGISLKQQKWTTSSRNTGQNEERCSGVFAKN